MVCAINSLFYKIKDKWQSLQKAPQFNEWYKLKQVWKILLTQLTNVRIFNLLNL